MTAFDAPSPPPPILELRGLCVEFGPRAARLRAVRGADLEIRRGETVALCGESGSGKSTLARAALRLIAPSAGRILIDGLDVTFHTQRQLRPLRRRVQLVFQDPQASLDPRMSVAAIVEEPLAIHGLCPRSSRRARAKELLAWVGLPSGLLDRRPAQLSGGQRQRVGIARALAVDPALVVLDEPLSSLDGSIQGQIVNLLLDLQRSRGLAYLLVAHDLRLVRFLADRVAIFYLGRIVEEGPVAELFDHPRHPYTRALLGSVPPLEPGAPPPAPIQGEPPSPLAPPSGCAFHPRCPLAFDRCPRESPSLVPLGRAGARVACFAAERDEAFAGAHAGGPR